MINMKLSFTGKHIYCQQMFLRVHARIRSTTSAVYWGNFCSLSSTLSNKRKR